MAYNHHFFFRAYSKLVVIAALGIAIYSCHSGASDQLDNPLVKAGQQLAIKHCGSCHLVPEPSMLDQETWDTHVLPAMAPMLGIESYGNGYYFAGQKAAVSYDNWQKIMLYYKALAPRKLKPADVSTSNDWSIFSLTKPQRDTTQTSETTMVVMDSSRTHLYSGDGIRNDLTCWDQQLHPVWRKQLKSPPVNAAFYRDKQGNERGVFTGLGTMVAADIAKGELLDLPLSGKPRNDSSTIYSDLPRPLQSLAADINRDGLTDWIVCGFGHLRGGLYWLKQEKNGRFTKLPIKEIPGAIQATTGDFNADGWPDVMVLFAHADEGIWLFLNDKKGGFTQQNLLRFPSVYGSTSFQLVDFNKDGKVDILYTCGDNSDYSQIFKPYHGVYVYLNQGNFQYKQAHFLAVNGCTKAIANDFDQDGDLDIISISFFADFKNNPAEGCLYFEQQKAFEFKRHALPVSDYGRWICMDVGDWDHDGDSDVVLGNFSKGFLNERDFKPTWDTHLPFIILTNTTRDKSR
ncbi:VCBS repeat-containing protein [Spirosoma sp. RP8]|uniref:VCBS repeat-containing protein n=1 Tax=Spirosoma liriopis TaxID=2937440 RepID=A0ABT0HGT2_9BACT|nr:VCBS repeat-containing protein [Spirosoma liriopis]